MRLRLRFPRKWAIMAIHGDVMSITSGDNSHACLSKNNPIAVPLSKQESKNKQVRYDINCIDFCDEKVMLKTPSMRSEHLGHNDSSSSLSSDVPITKSRVEPNKSSCNHHDDNSSSSLHQEIKKDESLTMQHHRDLVSAIFEIGINKSSPSTVTEMMRNCDEYHLTRERTKSHLQKYRERKQEGKAQFLKEYESFLQQIPESFPNAGHQALEKALGGGRLSDLVGGDAAAICTHLDSNKDNSINLISQMHRDEIDFPALTDTEKETRLGKSLVCIKELLLYVKNFTMERRHRPKAVPSAEITQLCTLLERNHKRNCVPETHDSNIVYHQNHAYYPHHPQAISYASLNYSGIPLTCHPPDYFTQDPSRYYPWHPHGSSISGSDFSSHHPSHIQYSPIPQPQRSNGSPVAWYNEHCHYQGISIEPYREISSWRSYYHPSSLIQSQQPSIQDQTKVLPPENSTCGNHERFSKEQSPSLHDYFSDMEDQPKDQKYEQRQRTPSSFGAGYPPAAITKSMVSPVHRNMFWDESLSPGQRDNHTSHRDRRYNRLQMDMNEAAAHQYPPRKKARR
jgi:SHAQKYF class myb-like DNA-binding protein